MNTVLITGGSGFFGQILVQELLKHGYSCISIDLVDSEYTHPNLHTYIGDIWNETLLDSVFTKHTITAVFHCAAQLAHEVKSNDLLWRSNVEATEHLCNACVKHNVQSLIFTSTNCLWGEEVDHPITEEEPVNPVEIYGRSKYEAEKILQKYMDKMHVVIIRCPTIMDAGRLGLLSILFEFIKEGRKIWLIGGGHNCYQFIYAKDLANACMQCMEYNTSATFHIGSDNVKSFHHVYNYVIRKAQTASKTVSIPKGLSLFLLKVLHMLRLSPLGPYQYKMIASNFEFDTSKIKKELGWKPTVTNEEMLWKAYEHYSNHCDTLERSSNVSAHKQPAKKGILSVVKFFS